MAGSHDLETWWCVIQDLRHRVPVILPHAVNPDHLNIRYTEENGQWIDVLAADLPDTDLCGVIKVLDGEVDELGGKPNPRNKQQD